MTNSYKSFRSPLPKLIIIHGLNNTIESFSPLNDTFKRLGFETHLMTLPGHGSERFEAHHFKDAQEIFNNKMEKIHDAPYVVIAFSYGALLFQLWLDSNPQKAPLCQVLLAPALYIKKWHLLNLLINSLPRSFFIFSQTPKILRRYNHLYIWEYLLLFECIKRFHTINNKIPVPTLILVDPKDELLDSKIMKKKLPLPHLKFIIFEKKSLRKELGAHHVMFHPDFFDQEKWQDMIAKIEIFITSHL